MEMRTNWWGAGGGAKYLLHILVMRDNVTHTHRRPTLQPTDQHDSVWMELRGAQRGGSAGLVCVSQWHTNTTQPVFTLSVSLSLCRSLCGPRCSGSNCHSGLHLSGISVTLPDNAGGDKGAAMSQARRKPTWRSPSPAAPRGWECGSVCECVCVVVGGEGCGRAALCDRQRWEARQRRQTLLK